MLDLNKIYCIDVLDGLKLLDDESIDLIITSPPYNLAGFRGKIVSTNNCLWEKNIGYGGDPSNDFMDEIAYQKWQVDILNECFRVLKSDGSMFYNHKIRVKKNKISHPLEWINNSKFICRQEIIWDRSSSINMDKCRYLPSTEKIFWLIKRQKNPRFKRQDNINWIGEVWKFAPSREKDHPAPFPIELPDNIIPCVSQGERIVVLDPFMGSGTVALSAIKHGCDYIGFEKFQEYIDLANKKRKLYTF